MREEFALSAGKFQSYFFKAHNQYIAGNANGYAFVNISITSSASVTTEMTPTASTTTMMDNIYELCAKVLLFNRQQLFIKDYYNSSSQSYITLIGDLKSLVSCQDSCRLFKVNCTFVCYLPDIQEYATK